MSFGWTIHTAPLGFRPNKLYLERKDSPSWFGTWALSSALLFSLAPEVPMRPIMPSNPTSFWPSSNLYIKQSVSPFSNSSTFFMLWKSRLTPKSTYKAPMQSAIWVSIPIHFSILSQVYLHLWRTGNTRRHSAPRVVFHEPSAIGPNLSLATSAPMGDIPKTYEGTPPLKNKGRFTLPPPPYDDWKYPTV